MSANLIVDIGNTANFCPSLVVNLNAASGGATSGQLTTAVGMPVDLSNTDTFCNVFVFLSPNANTVPIAIQTTDSVSGSLLSGGLGGQPLSGAFTDPTSGLAQMPTWFNSGCILYLNSGTYQLPGAGFPPTSGGNIQPQLGGYPPGTYPFGYTPVENAQGGPGFIFSGALAPAASGAMAFAAFQRPNRYGRIVLLSGGVTTSGTGTFQIVAGFVSQLMTTGSGGGFTQQPLSPNSVNV